VFYIISLFVGFGASGVSLIPCGVLINNWFVDKKGLATGIAFTGSVVGGLIFVQLTKYILAVHGWREAYAALGIIAALILLPTTILLVRETPGEKGLVPLGGDAEGSAETVEAKGIRTKAYVKTPSFWLMAASFFIIGFVNLGLQNNISIYLTKAQGHSAEFAANIFSIVMFVQIFGKILLGAIYDKKGIKFGAFYCAIIYVLATAALTQSGSLPLAIAFGALFGLVSAMTTVTPPYVAALVVGVRDYPTIYGLLSLFYGIGAATGPVVAGKVFDSAGSYDPAWIAYGALAIVLVVTSILAVKKGKDFSLIST
jgi:MFS family permease